MLFILLSMYFCHIVDDFYLQRILANMKCKSWWEEIAPDDLYKYDYIMALIMHSLSWAYMIMLPLSIMDCFNIGWLFAILFVINAIIHGIVDNLKANKHAINLIVDQTIHILQIGITFVIYTNLRV